MTDSDRKTVGVLLARLAEVFNTPLSQMRLSGYVEALSDHALATVQRMCTEALRTCKRFPSPAELRELARPAGPSAHRALPSPADGPRATRAQMAATLRAVAPTAAPRLRAQFLALASAIEAGTVTSPGEAISRLVGANLGAAVVAAVTREPGEDDDDHRPAWWDR